MPALARRSGVTFVSWLSALLISGCATLPVPYTGQGPHPQIQRGMPVPPVDFLGNVLSLPIKLFLWDWRFNRHYISPETEQSLIGFLDARELPAFEETAYRLNQYRPVQDLVRLAKNRHVAWPYRLLLGLPSTLLSDVLLPGRLFPWGDYYNPFTNTVHIYSDHGAIALHEAGHAYDLAKRRFKGSYAAVRLVPFVDLYQEYQATKAAITYLKETEDEEAELAAYKILYPAYGSYVGSYLLVPFGGLIGIAAGHVAGRTTAEVVERRHAREDQEPAQAPTEPSDAPAPTDPQEQPAPLPDSAQEPPAGATGPTEATEVVQATPADAPVSASPPAIPLPPEE